MNFQLGKALVISESSVLRDMLRLVLASHARAVFVARGIGVAMTIIAQNADVALVLSDIELIDGSGFKVLKYVRSLEALGPSRARASLQLVRRSSPCPRIPG